MGFRLTVFLCFLAIVPERLNATPLKDLMTSQEYRETVKVPYRGKEVAVDDGTNYSKLFLDRGDKARIFQALGLEVDGFRVVTSSIQKKDQYISASRNFQHNIKKIVVSTTVVIPRPSFIDLFERKLVVEANALLPSKGELASEAEVDLGGEKGTLLQTRYGKTMIYIKLPKEAFFIASMNQARDAQLMTKLVQAFTFGELRRQLES